MRGKWWIAAAALGAMATAVRYDAAGGQTGDSPFGQRQKVPPFPAGLEWINTAGPIELADLRGKFVLLDFWTYCCINCMHVIPKLKELEEKYKDEPFVVVGVHAAK